MTSIVGIQCVDGVVVATDSSATFTGGGIKTIEQPTMQKLKTFFDSVIVAGTGYVGHDQRFCNVIEQHCSPKNTMQVHPLEIAKAISRKAMKDFDETFSVGMNPSYYSCVVAFPSKSGNLLCEFDGKMQPELKTHDLWCCSIGSAQSITDPFLALMNGIFWKDGQPNLADGTFAALWALEHAIETNPGGVNGPVHIATLSNVNKVPRARILNQEELDEHKQNIEAAKNCLREFRSGGDTKELPLPPSKPT